MHNRPLFHPEVNIMLLIFSCTDFVFGLLVWWLCHLLFLSWDIVCHYWPSFHPMQHSFFSSLLSSIHGFSFSFLVLVQPLSHIVELEVEATDNILTILDSAATFLEAIENSVATASNGSLISGFGSDTISAITHCRIGSCGHWWCSNAFLPFQHGGWCPLICRCFKCSCLHSTWGFCPWASLCFCHHGWCPSICRCFKNCFDYKHLHTPCQLFETWSALWCFHEIMSCRNQFLGNLFCGLGHFSR